MRSQALSLLGALLVFGCESDDSACTLRGCLDGMAVLFEASAWPSGSYAFDFSADGKNGRCTAPLPLPACDLQPVTCTGDLEAMLNVSGCAHPVGSQSFGSLSILRTTPASVDITVTRDGTKIGSGTFHPTYGVTQPNGPRCEPTCRVASERLPLQQ